MKLFDNTKVAFDYKTDNQLNKAFLLFKFIQNPTLTKIGNRMVKFLINIRFPFIKLVVKKTLYAQFCGGETLNESLPNVQKMYNYGVSSILDYSVEGKEDEESFDRTMNEVLQNIDWAKEKNEIPFVVFKPTGVGSINLYEKVGQKKELNTSETTKWQKTLHRFETIAQKAAENKVPLMIDAEESWMQNAADEIVESLMKKYNTESCLICNTVQMYRHDRLDFLKKQYEKAKSGNYFIGFKVERVAL